jgi:hypothetical protein
MARELQQWATATGVARRIKTATKNGSIIRDQPLPQPQAQRALHYAESLGAPSVAFPSMVRRIPADIKSNRA